MDLDLSRKWCPRTSDDLSCGGGVIKLNGFGLI